MQLHLLSFPDGDSSNSGSRVVLPASVPAFMDLVRRGVPHVTTSGLLTAEDYRSIWREALLASWTVLQRALAQDKPGEPNRIVTEIYGFYMLAVQVLACDRALDRCAERFGIDEVFADDVAPAGRGDVLFPPDLYSSYFRDVGAVWAAARGIPMRVRARPAGASPPASGPSSRLFRGAARWRGRVRRIPSRLPALLGGVYARLSNLAYLAGGGRDLVFYLPYPACGLHRMAPPFAVDISPLLALARLQGRWRKRDQPGADATAEVAGLLDGLDGRLRRYASLLKDRLRARLESSERDDRAVFHGFQRLLAGLQRRGVRASYVATAAFYGRDGLGQIAEAFRQAGLPVAGIQHGGNIRLAHVSGVAYLFSDLLGGLYFQWGPGTLDEHEAYGITYPCRYVRTGSPRTAEIRKMRPRATRAGRDSRPRVLYAPTIPKVTMGYGSQVVWDKYLPILTGVLDILNRSGLDCTVKIQPSAETTSIGFSRYPNLRITAEGGFVDYLWDHDYLILDSLGASPIYESVVTDKPILLFTGIDHQIWDESYLAKVRRRAACVDEPGAYLDAVRRFAVDPEAFMRASGAVADSALADEYYPPTTPQELWRIIRETFRTTHQMGQALPSD